MAAYGGLILAVLNMCAAVLTLFFRLNKTRIQLKTLIII